MISTFLTAFQGYKVYVDVLQPASITFNTSIPFVHLTNAGIDTVFWILEAFFSVVPSAVVFLLGIVVDLA